MGRPGNLGVRNGLFGNKQLSLNNFNAELKARELAQNIKASSADANFMSIDDSFFKNATYRKDKDPDGYLDIIAHGNEYMIFIYHNGRKYPFKAKKAAKLIKKLQQHNNLPVRLLSCNTGKMQNGFAQNLANKLGVPVMAPNNILWNYSNKKGNMDVAPRLKADPNSPDLSKKGEFVVFYPRKKKVSLK